jgi:hypothetical protein
MLGSADTGNRVSQALTGAYSMKNLDHCILRLVAAQDQAAKTFWAYPNAAWQIAFQADWLEKHEGVTCGTTSDGLFWGKMEEQNDDH